ncbi:MAG: sigma-70 family RNA polymerase sigma factor [Nanoarchaeota archaeon]
MVKSKEIFEKVRLLKAQGETGKEISKKIGISKEMVYIIFSAIKQGFHSIPEYHDYVIKKIINPETGNKFLDINEYDNYISRKRGFKNFSNYVQFRKLEAKLNGKSLSKQEKFERSIRLFSLKKLDRKILDDKNLELEIENIDNLELLLNRIPDRYRKVLEMRYIDEKTQEEVGREINLTCQRVQQIEKRAFEYFLSGNKIRNYKTYNKIEDGELLLVYILSKSLEIKGESKLTNITDLDNEIYYNKKIRTKNQIGMMLYDRNYKERLKKIKEKYFPLSK